jgi:hypothetical protein
VTDSWNPADPSRPIGMKYEVPQAQVFCDLYSLNDNRFVGSDDFLRGKFEEYLCSALAAIKFADFVAKGKDNQIIITGSGND